MIQLQPATDWPVPYIARAVIGPGGIEGRCGHCRQVKPIWFFDVVRNVAKGPLHGGWCADSHDMECDECIDEFINTRADVRSVIKDGRKINESQTRKLNSGIIPGAHQQEHGEGREAHPLDAL